MKVVEHQVGSGVSNRWVVAQLREHKLPDLVRVSHRDMNDEVLGSSQKEDLDDLWVSPYLAHEIPKGRSSSSSQCY